MKKVLSTLPTLRTDAKKIFLAGIDAADPYKAVKRCLTSAENHLEILLDSNDVNKKRLGRWSTVHLIAFGKAACSMAKAANEIIPARLIANTATVVTNYQNVTAVDHFNVIGAGHPLPDQSGVNAAKIIAAIAQKAQQHELMLVLISGGGSALIPCPVDPITLDEKIAVTEILLASGATINQVNCIRKHLSRLKGGGLAKFALPADLHALILSDVPGNDVSAIASGPTVPDNSSFAQACVILRTNGVWEKIPESVREHLLQGAQGNIAETPKPGDSIFQRTDYTLIGSNAISIDAIINAAAKHHYQPRLYHDELSGEARQEAENMVIYCKQLLDRGIDKPMALLAGGETTVTLKGSGQGGRNQEMALAFALAAKKHKLPECWVFLSGGTDGRDGPTDAAGGIVDPETIERIKSANINPQQLLNNNDSYNALKTAKDLLYTGATGTNVADLQVLLFHPHT